MKAPTKCRWTGGIFRGWIGAEDGGGKGDEGWWLWGGMFGLLLLVFGVDILGGGDK